MSKINELCPEIIANVRDLANQGEYMVYPGAAIKVSNDVYQGYECLRENEKEFIHETVNDIVNSNLDDVFVDTLIYTVPVPKADPELVLEIVKIQKLSFQKGLNIR